MQSCVLQLSQTPLESQLRVQFQAIRAKTVIENRGESEQRQNQPNLMYLLPSLFLYYHKQFSQFNEISPSYVCYKIMKNIIESVLVKHLGKYIDGLKNSLDIGLLDGQVTIQNVSLKPSFINQLGLPFTLKFSHIERIHINIPWTNLKEKSTYVTVKGIYVLLNMSYEEIQEDINPEELLKGMIERIKMEMKKKWTENTNKEETFAEKNLIRIVDNAILNINNIHIRLQSFKRNWDYSLGVIMDDITSYTVDEYEQKTFYHRSFSKKQTNKLFKKILNIQTFQIYFNDDEKVFMSNELTNGHTYMIKMMAHPFPNRDQNMKSSSGKKKIQQVKHYPHYKTKAMTNISLTAVGSQKFAEDMRYIVDLNIVINTIDMKIGDKQLSQMIYCMQHFYEYGLNIIKNGRKGYNFGEEVQKFYRGCITKIAKQQKITKNQIAQLQSILQEVPLSTLQTINDQIIGTVRFDIEMKKISKIGNAEKSKKLMQELLQKKEKLDAMEGVDIFKEVVIAVRIDRVLINLNNSNTGIAELGILGILIDVQMDLKGIITINCKFMNIIMNSKQGQITKDFFEPGTPMITLQLQIQKQIKKIHLQVQRKQIYFSQQLLLSLIDWISLIKIRPSLLNYLEEQLNYSIDITRVMMKFLFAKGRNILLNVGMPLVKININKEFCIALDLGKFMGKNREKNTQFLFQLQPIRILSNDLLIMTLDSGSSINLIDRIQKITNFETVHILLKNMHIQNADSLIRLVYSLKDSPFIKIYDKLSLIDQTLEQKLEGQFYLNKLKAKMNIYISRTGLLFKPTDSTINIPDQKISLLRTRIYKLVSKDKFYIVFKQQVDKLVNIVQASNAKVMQTIFIKLKDYIQQICTAFQWQKYYRQLYKQTINTLQQIQDINLNNDTLMKLCITLQTIKFDVSNNAHMILQHTGSQITYNEFNTDATLQLRKVDLVIQGQKIIYDAGFKGSYQYLQSMIITFQVCKLNYNIKLFSTFSTIIAISSQYQLLMFSLKSQRKEQYAVVEEDEGRLGDIKTQNNRADNINKFLLERMVSVQTTNIEGEILGYRNLIKYIKVESLKYRNQPHPQITADLKGILLFSMIELPSITFKITPTLFELKVDSINAQINLAIIIYQIVKGEGSLIVRELIKALKNRKIAENQLKQQQKLQSKTDETVAVKQLLIKIDQIRIQFAFTGSLCLGVNTRDIELQSGRLSWMGTLVWLNGECISMNQNNGILKWNDKHIDLCMTNCKLKLNSKQILFLVNQLYKIYKFLKINQFDMINFVQKQIEHPDQKGRVLQQDNKLVNIRIEQVQIIYECGDKNPLVSIRLKPLFLTNDGNINTINFSIWHLNRSLKLYEPIIQPFTVRLIQKKQTNQYEFIMQQLFIITTQQFIIDTLNQVKLLQEIQNQLSKDQSNQLEEMCREEVDRSKELMLEQQFQYYQQQDFKQNLQYSFVLKITNYLSCKMIVEVGCGRRQKQRLYYQAQQLNVGQIKNITIPQKTSYNHSYELIERYQKIQLKICLVNHCYAIRTAFISFLLYDQDNYYIQPVTIVDSNGQEITSSLAVKVQYYQGIYLIDIMGMYSLQNDMKIPVYFRYSDFYSINKFVLNRGDNMLLPLWIVQTLTFGFEDDNFTHVLKLRTEGELEVEGGLFELSFELKNGTFVNVVIQKEKTVHRVKEQPKLKYLKQKSKDQKIIDQFNKVRKSSIDQDSKQKIQDTQPIIQKKNQHIEATFKYKIIPGMLIHNHINFPITVNDTIFQHDELSQLNIIYKQSQKQYIKLSLGDQTMHQLFIPQLNTPCPITLKVTQDNYITIILQVRRNKQEQRIIHIYTEVHLIFNIPNLHEPSILTNIYQNMFIIKKIVKNNYSDRIHPTPILKDKFVFNTFHYLLNLQQKYITVKLNGAISNQIIVYHSDFDKDLKFKLSEQSQQQYIYAVSYESKLVQLQTNEQGRKPQILQCNYTYIMPKYYLINRSQGTLVVDGNILIRGGEKISLNGIKYIDLNIRDQLEYKFIAQSFRNNCLLFVRGKENKEDSQSAQCQLDQNQKISRIQSQFSNLDMLRSVTEVTERSTSRIQDNDNLSPHKNKQEESKEKGNKESNEKENKEVQEKGSKESKEQIQSKEIKEEKGQSANQNLNIQSLKKQQLQQIQISEKTSSKKSKNSIQKRFSKIKVQKPQLTQDNKIINDSESDSSQPSLKHMKHIVQMDDIRIFSLNKRICDYNTISYEINQWNEWLTINNQLSHPIIIRTKIHENIAGVLMVKQSSSGKIISGLSEDIQIGLIYQDEQVMLGRFSLGQRLNHNLFLKDCEYDEIILKQNKLKVGRLMRVTCPKMLKNQGVYKVIHSIQLTIKKICVSLIFNQQKIRKQLVRINLNDLKLMLLEYKNGLYMFHISFQNIHGMFKRMPFIILKQFKGYLQGFKGQFIERLSIECSQPLQITLSDQLIVSIMGQLQTFQKHLPSTVKLNSQQIVSQQQETYHINSLGIKKIQIKLCMRKIISDMTENKSRLLSKLSLSMVEVEDAYIHLSPIEIDSPLKQKHINGISKMYTMQSFVGIASGLNILGNPAQFANQFEAGRNKGGVVPFFRSIVAGTSNSVSKIIGTIGSSVSQLTFDRQFMKHRIHNKNIKAQNFGMGLKIGFREFAHSLKSGFTGVVEQPFLGHKEQGGMGALKGTIAGLTGLITKPLTGFIFAASKTIQGINSSTTYLDYKILQRQQLITRPLYHKFKLVRPYRSEDQLAYNILLNWYDYSDVQLIGGYLLQNEEGDSIIQILIITCSQLILIDLDQKEVVLKLKIEQLLATGKFLQGVVLYFQDDDDQDQIVFRLRNDPTAKQNLYWTLKGFIGLYAQEQ